MSLSRSHAIELRNLMLSGFARVRNRKTTGTLLELDAKGNAIAACAMGALALGLYPNEPAIRIHSGYLQPWPEHIPHPEVQNPVSEAIDDLETIIVELNDTSYWPVERIAEWIACLPTQDCCD